MARRFFRPLRSNPVVRIGEGLEYKPVPFLLGGWGMRWRKLVISVSVVVMAIQFVFVYPHQKAEAFVQYALKQAVKPLVVATAQRMGAKFSSKAAAEKAAEKWANRYAEQYAAEMEATNTKFWADYSAGAARSLPSNVPQKSGWGTTALNVAMFVTGLDLFKEAYDAFQGGQAVTREVYAPVDAEDIAVGMKGANVYFTSIEQYQVTYVVEWNGQSETKSFQKVAGIKPGVRLWVTDVVQKGSDVEVKLKCTYFTLDDKFIESYPYAYFPGTLSSVTNTDTITVSAPITGVEFTPTTVTSGYANPIPVQIPAESADPIGDLVANPDMNPVVDPAAEPVPDPGTDPVPNPGTDPTTDPVTDPWTSPKAPETATIDWTPLLNDADLTKKFPFSIPWDLKAQLSVFNVSPVAPKFNVDVPKFITIGSLVIPLKFSVDLAQFDRIATLARWFLTIAVDVGFVLGMRRLMPE